jgi:HD-GYP domain-containing protein (c-di-GMP phosphodiesterase class II)
MMSAVKRFRNLGFFRSRKVTRLWKKLIPGFIMRTVFIAAVLSTCWSWLVYTYQARQVGKELLVTMSVLNTAGTICIITLVLYPLIHASYRALKKDSRELLESNIYTILALGNAIAQRDSNTDEHNYRVTYFSLCLGEALNLPPQSIRTLVKGAFLHDVGKIGIQDDILLKPSDLSNEEYEVMKTHVQQGVRIVDDIPWLQDSKDVIRFHHERYDGGGYPLGISGDRIPMVARIFSLVDVFDALISKRPYKSAMSYDDAIEILRQQRQLFDPQVFSCFIDISKSLFKSAVSMEKKEYDIYLTEKIIQYFEV